MDERMKIPYVLLVEGPPMVCSWCIKYSVHMLNMSDVLVDVVELYLKCKG